MKMRSTLAYNIIIVPSFECLYESEFNNIVGLPENLSGNFKELKKFCLDRELFIVIINIMYPCVTQDPEQKKMLNWLAEKSKNYGNFLTHLKSLETDVQYNFNMLVWKDQLDDEDCINRFLARTWDTFEIKK